MLSDTQLKELIIENSTYIKALIPQQMKHRNIGMAKNNLKGLQNIERKDETLNSLVIKYS